MKAKDTREWCWCYPHSEEANGPFTTRARALADARREGAKVGAKEVELGRVVWADPASCARLDVEWLLEHIEQHAKDNGFDFCDDDVFTLKHPQRRVEENLDAALAKWAAANLAPAAWHVDEGAETVTLTSRKVR